LLSTNKQITLTKTTKMHLQILLTTTLLLAFVSNSICQYSFPFELENGKYSSYCGLIAGGEKNAASPKKTIYADLDEPANAAVPSTNNSNPLIDNNGNEFEPLSIDHSTKPEMTAVKILYLDVGYACDNNLEVTLGFETYTMNTPELNLSLPKGRYYYKIKGNLACASADGCQINNTGIIDIEASGTFHLSWQVTEYQNCWMTLHSSDYPTKVID
jgi:hypothetical protein